MDRHLQIIRGIIENGIELDMLLPDMLGQLEKHFNKSRHYQTAYFHHRAFLVMAEDVPVAKINIEDSHLTFDFSSNEHVYSVIMEALQYLYNLRWN